jgi:hypothetical protein
MKASDKRGLKVPWAYIRRELAKAWGIPPWEVDEADPEEIRIELAIRKIESENQPPS